MNSLAKSGAPRNVSISMMMIPKEKQSTVLSYFCPAMTSGEIMAEILYLFRSPEMTALFPQITLVESAINDLLASQLAMQLRASV